MILTGFTDEVSPSIGKQIEACRHLGWDSIDLRTLGEKNICHLSLPEMDELMERLSSAGIRPICFGSTIANWSRTTAYSLKDEIEELKHAALLMRRAGTGAIRIMSYKTDKPVSVGDPSGILIARRLKELSRVAEDEGITLFHENCETWGGQSFEHTLFLLDQIQSESFKLIFDTGNPPGTPDLRGEGPYDYQRGLPFLKEVYSAVGIVHIKDSVMKEGKLNYVWPGEGAGEIPEILSYLKKRNFSGPVSIEPHMAVVFHDASVHSGEEQRWNTFVEYARRTEVLLKEAGF